MLSPSVQDTHALLYVKRSEVPFGSRTATNAQLPQYFQSYSIPNPVTWNVQSLVDKGHMLLQQSCVVIEHQTDRILALVTRGKDSSMVKNMVSGARQLYTACGRCGGNVRKCKIRMVGLKKGSRNPDGVERYRSNEHVSNHDRMSIVSMAIRLTFLERLLAPALSLYKLDQAQEYKFPGILPGVRAEECSASALGVSRGYSSGPHRDRGVVENITWDLSRGPKDDDYGFSLYDCGVIVDLTHDDVVNVLIAGDVVHGTLCTAERHGAIGIVLIQKDTLFTNMEFNNMMDMYACEKCGREDDVTGVFCDKCDRYWHLNCLRAEDRPSRLGDPAEEWVCPIHVEKVSHGSSIDSDDDTNHTENCNSAESVDNGSNDNGDINQEAEDAVDSFSSSAGDTLDMEQHEAYCDSLMSE